MEVPAEHLSNGEIVVNSPSHSRPNSSIDEGEKEKENAAEWILPTVDHALVQEVRSVAKEQLK